MKRIFNLNPVHIVFFFFKSRISVVFQKLHIPNMSTSKITTQGTPAHHVPEGKYSLFSTHMGHCIFQQSSALRVLRHSSKSYLRQPLQWAHRKCVSTITFQTSITAADWRDPLLGEILCSQFVFVPIIINTVLRFSFFCSLCLISLGRKTLRCIRHFIVQIMHTIYEILRLLKYFYVLLTVHFGNI